MQLESALRTVGCRGDELSALWLLLAAILHMSNLTCEGSEESGPVAIAVESIALENLTEILGVSVELFKRFVSQPSSSSSQWGDRDGVLIIESPSFLLSCQVSHCATSEDGQAILHYSQGESSRYASPPRT